MLKQYLCLLLFIAPVLSQAQEKSFSTGQKKDFQEKVYLHTDKPHYSTGENIWFRIYRVDAISQTPNLYSRFVYVELIDQKKVIVKRIKVIERDSGFYGNIKIPDNLTQGDYCIRAYTNWMQNNDPAFFFKKTVTIFNPGELQVNLDVTYLFEMDSSLTARVCLRDPEKKPYANVLLQYKLLNKETEVKDVLRSTDAEGHLDINIPHGKQVTDIRIAFYKENPFYYKSDIHLPLYTSDFDCQFMPEGGNLISGKKQIVAFKAIGNNGLSVEIKGTLYDNENNRIDSIQSTHKGMGKLSFTPRPGKEYHARITSAAGQVKQFSLPKVKDKGITISLIPSDSTITCELMSTAGFAYPPQLNLFTQCNGNFLTSKTVSHDTVFTFPDTLFPEGIVQFALIGQQGKVYAERLVFNLKDNRPQLMVTTDKSNYDKRDKVTLSISLPRNNTTSQADASLSLAVTDNRLVRQDTLADNIISYLLLSSDIKGYIEEPAYYFTTSITLAERKQKLDILMSTQGWKRFDIGKYSQGIFADHPHHLEIAQYISGNIKTPGNKPSENNIVSLYSPDHNLKWFTQTDEKGNFAFDNLYFPDTITLLTKVFAKKENRSLEITLDSVHYPKIPDDLFYTPYYPSTSQSLKGEDLFTFYKESQQKFYYENGQKIYLLGEVTVQGNTNSWSSRFKPPKGTPDIYSSLIDRGTYDEEIAQFKCKHLEDALRLIAMVDYDPITGEIYYKKSLVRDILIDNMRSDPISLQKYQPGDIKSAGITRVFPRPTLIIYLKPYKERQSFRRGLNYTGINSLGYQCPDEFYVPRYDLPEIKQISPKDERNTIYWNPKLKTDAQGNCQAAFYTADDKGIYHIVIEGVTQDGKAFRHTSILKRE